MILFAYGTLMRGGRYAAKTLGDSEHLGRAVTLNRFRMRDVGFPFAWFDVDGHPIEGDLWRVTDPLAIARVDELESRGLLYERAQVVMHDGRLAEIYLWIWPERDTVGVPVAPDEDGVLRWRDARLEAASPEPATTET